MMPSKFLVLIFLTTLLLPTLSWADSQNNVDQVMQANNHYLNNRYDEAAQIYEEPVLISGKLTVHEGPGVKYFYSITEASFGPGDLEGALNPRRLNSDHLIPRHDQDPELIDPKYKPYDSQ